MYIEICIYMYLCIYVWWVRIYFTIRIKYTGLSEIMIYTYMHLSLPFPLIYKYIYTHTYTYTYIIYTPLKRRWHVKTSEFWAANSGSWSSAASPTLKLHFHKFSISIFGAYVSNHMFFPLQLLGMPPFSHKPHMTFLRQLPSSPGSLPTARAWKRDPTLLCSKSHISSETSGMLVK